MNDIIESFEEIPAEPVELAKPAPAPMMGGLADSYCSLKGGDRATGLAIFDAISNADSLEDHMDEVINVHDLFMVPVELTDPVTGEVRDAVRVVLMCDEGNFATCSKGVLISVNNLVASIGKPTWEPPVALRVEKKKGTRFKFTNLVLA